MVSSRQQKFLKTKGNRKTGSRKMRASKRVLRGGRRFLKRELSFGMKKKVRYRTDLQPLILVYSLAAFLVISFIAIIYGDYKSVPWYYYLLVLFGLVTVDIYVLGGKRFD